METRSGRRLSSPPPPPPGACRGRTPRDADLISALPDDILLLVLVRLRCVLAAARTSLLARRWRGLWTRLPDLAFHRVAPATVESALARFAASPAVSLIYIRLQFGHTAAQANSLLRAAAAVSPAELVCKCPGSREDRFSHIELPCFHRTTSIELETLFSVKPPTTGEFAALERLSLNADVFDLGALLNRCPRLRVLSATFWDTELLVLQSVRELAALERLTLNGNIADLGTFLNRCPRLRLISITFRSVAPDSLEEALATIAAVAAHGAAVSLLGIRIPSEHSDDTVLLRAAARLSPQEFAFMHLLDSQGPQYTNVDLPCFPRTTSIKIAVHNICFTQLLDGEFSKLERLSLEGCIINDLGTLLSRCPRLRVLKVETAMSRYDIKVHSASLQELVFGTHTECRGIEIVTTMLKQLEMEVQADKDIRVFISAPLLEMVSWRRSYTGSPIVFGVWHLQNLSLERQRVLTDKHLQNPSSDGQRMLANNHVLFMDMCASDSSDAELDFAQEIRKILVTDFSVLNLSLKTMGHVYGATLLQLFGVLQVHSAMKILKVNLLMSKKSEVTQACSENCPCDSPKIWRSQSISMNHLEEVEIKGVIGEVHEFDALKLILRCVPLLKRMTVELGDEMEPYGYGGCTKEINDISLEYPSVDFHVYHSCTLVLDACSSCT